MEQKVDFHIHTYYSDGASSPADIVWQAKALNYNVIAITDHDGIDGVEEAKAMGEELGLEVISGIELATETADGTELHILGHYIDIYNCHLQQVLCDLREKRNRRNEKMLKALADMGYPLSEEDLTMREGQTFLGKPIIARAMEAKGYITHRKEAFRKGKILDAPEIRKIAKEKLSTEEAIALIEEAGGVSVLAHPIQIKEFGKAGSEEFYQKVEELLKALKQSGLKGLECYHPDQNAQQAERFRELAEKYQLQITRGSDFHGAEFR